ncbi:MAG: glycosyltransferase family protein [Lachnospiraceae bacterium]|nr:glycosyltransferase family protein [Lachnospiraceae bacterium]
MDKIAFIICHNNEQYLEECIFYLSKLHIPEGMETENICISEAKSMAAGYNEGMKASDAKYKVYLHQDVFITDTEFLVSISKVFQSDPKIGLLGVYGGSKIPENGSCYDKWDIGWIRASNGNREVELRKEYSGPNGKGYYEAEAIDGMLMATSVDLFWREDLFDGFDYYDVSQSVEFLRSGYRVVVPAFDAPPCIHDCGYSKLVEYDRYRKIFCEAYGGGFHYDGAQAVDPSQKEAIKLTECLFVKCCELFDKGDLSGAFTILEQVDGRLHVFHNGLNKLCNMRKVYLNETGQHVFSFGEIPVAELIEKYDTIRFMLRRAEFEKEEAVFSAHIKELVDSGILSRESVCMLYPTVSTDPGGCIKRIWSL